MRFCIRPLIGTFVFLAIMDIRARPISFSVAESNLGATRHQTGNEYLLRRLGDPVYTKILITIHS